MKKYSTTLLLSLFLTLISLSVFAQKNNERRSVLDQQYEVQYIGVGQDGTKVFTVMTTAKKVEDGIEMAKRDAVAACLFRGITASGQTKATPAIISTKVAEDNLEYFESFLALPTNKTPGGQYHRFINRTGQPQSVKNGKMYNVSIDVQVLYDDLLKYMQDKGYAEKVKNTEVGKYVKPMLMVVPSDVFCNEMGFVNYWTDANGNRQKVVDYDIFDREESRDLRLVIASLNEIFNNRGFETQSLEFLVKSMKQEDDENAFIGQDYGLDGSLAESPIDRIKRTSNVDYIIDLDFELMERGTQRYVTFNMRAVDQSANAKEIAHAHGDGKPSNSATINTLLEEAVLNHMDGFCKKLQDNFVDMSENGRQITVKVKRTDNSDYELLKTSFVFEGEETVLSDIIYYWLQDNTVDNNPTRMLSPNVLTFNQVMIPLTKVGRRGAIQRIDVNEYLTSLQSFLRSNFDIESTVYMRGPSEGWIIL
ncbi:MAG: DUF6175 family protein [Bacteroidales bacterium]|nr:hypothetical protein [Bacteroidales bacterium]MDD7277195.1 DUF6175 family protein [Bacteroidales bacterium]